MSGQQTVVRPVRQSRRTSIVLGVAGATWSSWTLWQSWSNGEFSSLAPWHIATIAGITLIALAVLAWFRTSDEVVVNPHVLHFASDGEAIEMPTAGTQILVVKEIDREYVEYAIPYLPGEGPPQTTVMYVQQDGDPSTRRRVDVAAGLTPRRMQGFKEDLEHAMAAQLLVADPIFRRRDQVVDETS